MRAVEFRLWVKNGRTALKTMRCAQSGLFGQPESAIAILTFSAKQF